MNELNKEGFRSVHIEIPGHSFLTDPIMQWISYLNPL